jgi:hypothetical protein
MTGPVLALILITVVHFVGMGVLIALMGRDVLDLFRSGPGPGGGGGGEPPSDTPMAPPRGGGGGVPMPDAEQARVRLRGPGRIATAYPRPPRRPEHEPERTPAPRRTPA